MSCPLVNLFLKRALARRGPIKIGTGQKNSETQQGYHKQVTPQFNDHVHY